MLFLFNIPRIKLQIALRSVAALLSTDNVRLSPVLSHLGERTGFPFASEAT